MDTEIHNADLSTDDVPVSTDDPTLAAFALTFDGYAHWGNQCGAEANAAAAAFHRAGALPSTLSDLRACLFYEHERWRWRSTPPDDGGRRYLQALLDAIRDAIEDAIEDAIVAD